MNIANLSSKPPLVVIAGPTASGKSALALALSRLLRVRIINADASQVYRDLRLLSARPADDELAQAPHALFGHIDGAIACSAADWAEQARGEVRAAHDAGEIPVLVGGTGLYLRTLLDGIAPVPEIDPAIRAEVRALPLEAAFAALCDEDQDAAGRLSPKDATRIARALEVVRSSGRVLSDWQKQLSGGIGAAHHVAGAILLPERDWLRARCDTRFEAMIAAGALAEVETLRARALDPLLPVMRAIGVPQLMPALDAPEGLAAAICAGQAATRQYAKRQYTWFRHQPPADWPRWTQHIDNENINELAIKLRDMALTS